MRKVESEVLRAIGKGSGELKLGVARQELWRFDGTALDGGDGDVGESMVLA